MTKEVKENCIAKGLYKLIEADPARAPKEYEAVLGFLERNPLASVTPGLRAAHDLLYRKLLNAYHAKAIVAEHVFANIAPTIGRSVLAQRLAGTTTYTGTINYAALGDSTTIPTNGDTALGNETYRQTLSSQNYVNNVAYLSTFIPAGSATGTHKEGGLFIDGGAGAGTGQLFSHVLFSPAIVKAALNSLTLDVSAAFS